MYAVAYLTIVVGAIFGAFFYGRSFGKKEVNEARSKEEKEKILKTQSLLKEIHRKYELLKEEMANSGHYVDGLRSYGHIAPEADSPVDCGKTPCKN